MGWNSWNCYGDSIDNTKIIAAADGLVKTGLINHGWLYVTTDEGWTMKPSHTDLKMQGPERDAQDKINSNPKFPDMKKLADYIHGLGLKAGIYTSPGPFACGEYTGSYQHEDIDAKQFADWGYDYLKYDMCSYNRVLETKIKPGKDNTLTKPMDKKSQEYLTELQVPWKVMRSSLDKVNRDIIYSISGNPRNWGKEVGGNSWRTSSDIIDSWDEILNGWEMSITHIGFTDKPNQSSGEEFCNGPELVAPGHFNDRDMLVVGHVGWSNNSHPTRLTPNEQYTHVSLWCLQASPLMLGCDLAKMDAFTLSLLTNDEVLDVNQDPLAKQAVRVVQKGDFEIWVKDMEDGSKAVGLFNRGYWGGEFTAKWSDIGIKGSQKVRDLWRQQDLGIYSDSFTTKIERHGVVLLQVWPK
jgi:alpha-galactosidase